MPKSEPALDVVFRALADPTRRAVLARLCLGPCSTTELAGEFDMALPSFMQHLGVLEASGLVSSAKHGRVRTWELSPEPLEEAAHWLSRQRRRWERRLDQLDHYLAAMADEEQP